MEFPPLAGDAERALARELGTTLTAACILSRRGLVGRAEVESFFSPRLSELTPPVGMAGREEAVTRLAEAVSRGERVCVFGDYDADGVTSAALLTEFLRDVGGNVIPLLAHRFDGGYGLSAAALSRVKATGVRLLVTCDCGSSDHERLSVAERDGIDVVVIDHHRVPEEPLPVLAFLNPHQPGCAFPFKGLASVGLAFNVAAGVRTRLGLSLDMRKYLDLVALGTVADVAPLTGDNRALVRAGLSLLSNPKRPGVLALRELLGAVSSVLTGEDIAFGFAPRINAPGRLTTPDLALELLLSKTLGEARGLAAAIEQISTERKRLDKAMFLEAREMLVRAGWDKGPAIVLGKQGWHPGVVGIVAGRIASEFQKPTVVMGFDGEEGRGSVRGPSGFPLYDALSLCREALMSFGGHQAAAGVHVAFSALDRFRDRFCAACEGMAYEPAPPPLADARFEPGELPEQVLRDLLRFEPCGEKNPMPRLLFPHVYVRGLKEVSGGHLQADLVHEGTPLRGFGLSMGGLAKEGVKTMHAVGRLRMDAYRGGGAVEIKLDRLIPATEVG